MTIQDNAAPLILFVDDEATAVKYFGQALESLAPVVAACSAEEGKRVLERYAQSLLLVVTDQRMPGGYGNELLQHVREHYPHMLRILTTAYSELDNTVEAINHGQVHRYIQKPWETSALKLELKQALDLARLRKEHAELLREKMAVRQQQTVAGRIGMLHALCGSFIGPDNFEPQETYLAAAAAVGVKAHEAAWLMMDYAGLASAEARRGARLGYELHERLAITRQHYRDWQAADGLGPLAEALHGAQAVGDDAIVIPDLELFVEFFDSMPGAPLSARHVSWLALLIWLHEKGCVLGVSMRNGAMHCRLESAPTQVPAERLDYWVERFCET